MTMRITNHQPVIACSDINYFWDRMSNNNDLKIK